MKKAKSRSLVLPLMSSESTDTLNPNQSNPAENGDAVPPAPAASEGTAVTAEALAAAKSEAADNYNRYLRAVADLENFRRRTVREKDDLRQFAASGVLEDLLPVVDNLALALNAAGQPNATVANLTGGVEMVLTQLKSALGSHGLKEINPVGQAFDANLHEAISAQPSANIPEGDVITVVRPGFSLNGRLLRPASVVVSSGQAQEEKLS
ncbi:MAG TPA: nucleotide exchange factor GrpE [Opitutus sp.]|nr:nucleotide exchange factor GrpE [Opitutus sp.]